EAAIDVPRADHERHLHPPGGHFVDLRGDPLDAFGIGAVIERPHQRLPGELQEHALETRLSHRFLVLTDDETGEAGDPNVLTGLRRELGTKSHDRLALVSVAECQY